MKNGKHLIIDAYKCSYSKLWDKELISSMLLEVTKKIGLKPLSDTLIYIVDETMIAKEDTGITGGIIFMESHFTFHAFPEQHYFSADVYSCNDFEHSEIVTYIKKLFEAKEAEATVLIRGHKL